MKIGIVGIRLAFGELVQQQDQLLRAAESKRGNDDLASAFRSAHHGVARVYRLRVRVLYAADPRMCSP